MQFCYIFHYSEPQLTPLLLWCGIPHTTSCLCYSMLSCQTVEALLSLVLDLSLSALWHSSHNALLEKYPQMGTQINPSVRIIGEGHNLDSYSSDCLLNARRGCKPGPLCSFPQSFQWEHAVEAFIQ